MAYTPAAARPLADWLPYVKPWALGASDLAMTTQIRLAAIEFCEETKVWKDYKTVDILANDPVYAIPVPTDASSVDITEAYYNGHEIRPTNIDELKQAYADGRGLSWGEVSYALSNTPGYSIASLTLVGTTATLVTTVAHGLVAGQYFSLTGVGLGPNDTNGGWNNVWLTVTVPNSTTLTFTVGNPLLSSPANVLNAIFSPVPNTTPVSPSSQWFDDVGEPVAFLQPDQDSFQLVPKPATSLVQGVKMRVSYKPTKTAATLPDILFSSYAEDIGHGALAKLLAIPKMAYSNPELAVYYQGLFDAAIGKSKVDAAKGFTRSVIRVRGHR